MHCRCHIAIWQPVLSASCKQTKELWCGIFHGCHYQSIFHVCDRQACHFFPFTFLSFHIISLNPIDYASAISGFQEVCGVWHIRRVLISIYLFEILQSFQYISTHAGVIFGNLYCKSLIILQDGYFTLNHNAWSVRWGGTGYVLYN